MVFLINDIILQYLRQCPDPDIKINCWNQIQKNEDTV